MWKLDAKLKSFSLVSTIHAVGVINSLQLVSTPKGWEDAAQWSQRKPPEQPRKKTAPPTVLVVAGVGQETRLGRWITVKGDGARNQTFVFALHPRTVT